MQWAKEFWYKHGERIIYMVAATGFAIFFYSTGDEKLIGSAYTILIGVAMQCFHKARGNGKEK